MAATMTSRQRVLAALNHSETDRVPIDLGSTTCSSVCTGAYQNLARALGVATNTPLLSLAFELVEMEKVVLDRLPVDTRGIFGRPPANFLERWIDDDTFVDEWGITFRRPPNWMQFDMVRHPLAEAVSLDDIENHTWPDPYDDGRIAGLKDHARSLKEDTDFAVVGDMVNTGFFEPSWYVRSMPLFLEDLLLRPEFASALMEKIVALQMKRYDRFLAEVGKYLDVVVIGDDLAAQQRTTISPALYRKMVKPLQKKYFAFVKERTDAKLFYHSCGNITAILDDLIEVGVDAINPVQVAATDMEVHSLKARFGDRVTFWGAIDTQHLLPSGTQEEVRASVRETIAALNRDGGYILAAVHNVQDDVPPENLLAMLNEAARPK